MKQESIEIQSEYPGVTRTLSVWRFGAELARPKVFIQAALHADEVPAILVVQALQRVLMSLEAQGRLLGQVVLVPNANPIGLTQQLMGQHHGRFDLRDGTNFNRGFAELGLTIAEAVRPLLTQDLAANTGTIRAALLAAVAGLPAAHPTQDLKNRLLGLAIDADVVLDLHCDSEAVMHLYALTPQAPMAAVLGACLGARTLLLATESGGSPFDEACSRPWYQLQRSFTDVPIALACFGATIELRGVTDTGHALAAQDAQSLCQFLTYCGALVDDGAPLPKPQCAPTMLEASEPIQAPHVGVVVFHRDVGDVVAAGDVIADLVHPLTGDITPLRTQSGGLLYARCGSRWASQGKRLAKVAGTELARTGPLLSP
jgi:uncharacterized protein